MICLIFTLIFTTWAIWISIILRRMYYTNMKDLVESDVKFYSDYIVAQRYDCINIDLVKFTLVGIFLLPMRLFLFVSSTLILYFWTKIIGAIYGGKLKLEIFGYQPLSENVDYFGKARCHLIIFISWI